MIKAFTLIELLVALIISVMLIGLSAGVYGFVVKRMSIYKQANREIREVALLHAILQRNVSSCERIIYHGDEIVFTGSPNISYQFKDKIFRLNPDGVDTFNVQAENKKFLFHTKNVIGSSHIVDEIKFSTQLFDHTEPFHFIKVYDAATLMQLENLQ